MTTPGALRRRESVRFVVVPLATATTAMSPLSNVDPDGVSVSFPRWSMAYDLGVKKPEKTLSTPSGSVYEQVTSVLGSKPEIP
jgi:hypothetical protein